MTKTFIGNENCPDCSETGTSKSRSRYKLEDGREFTTCRDPKCPTKGKAKFNASSNYKAPVKNFNQYRLTREDIQTYPTKDLDTRGIREDTAKKYGVKVSYNETTGEIDTHYFPYYIKKQLAGYKVRRLPKEFLGDIGSIKGVDPFGWQKVKSAKKLIITEGEYDCMVVYQVLMDYSKKMDYNIEPQVISLASGAQVKTLLKEKEKDLRKYDEVVLCFDMDEAGQQAVQDFAVAFDSDKVKVMELPCKDANDTLLEEGPQAIVSAFYNAQPPRLGGMVSLRDCFNMAYEEEEKGLSYPWDIMTKQSGGLKSPEIVIIMSGTGAGKTDIVTEIVRYIATVHELDIAFYSLEMSLQKSAKRLISKQVGRKQLHDATEEQRQQDEKATEKLLDKVKFYDIKQGMLDAKHLIYLMKQQAALDGTQVHVIDNLTQLTSGDKNEKAIIDQFIKDLKDLSERYGLRVFLIVHLNRNSSTDRGFEAGAQIGLEHLYGSGGPAKWADTVLALERNQYHPDEETRNTTICRWLKDRSAGESTGRVFALKYNSETGELTKTAPIDITKDDEKDEEF